MQFEIKKLGGSLGGFEVKTDCGSIISSACEMVRTFFCFIFLSPDITKFWDTWYSSDHDMVRIRKTVKKFVLHGLAIGEQ